MLRAIALAFALSVFPATAFANSCPSIMAAIDAALPASTLAEADMTKVKELRAKGEQLHASGDHAGSEAALDEAKKRKYSASERAALSRLSAPVLCHSRFILQRHCGRVIIAVSSGEALSAWNHPAWPGPGALMLDRPT